MYSIEKNVSSEKNFCLEKDTTERMTCMKTALITGAGTGLGKELALLLSEKGYFIYACGRNKETLNETIREITERGGQGEALTLDVRSFEDVSSKIAALSRPIDLLVNNAGVGFFGPFLQSTYDEMNQMFTTNVYGPIFLTKAVLPSMRERNNGVVLNIISTAGLRGKKNEALYVASKFALRGFTESLQKEYEGTGIRYVAAYMGGMNTPFWDDSDHISDKSRLRSPKEVAEFIVERFETESEIVIESKK
jgi:short-subunit dehydrogenase